MSIARTARSAADPTLSIPPLPCLARRPATQRPDATALQTRRALDALREASLVGTATLALCWGLAELVVVLVGAAGTN